MNSRLKLSILIATTCFVVAGAIGIIAWAIAAANIGVSSKLSVTYTASQNVVCEASATYQKTTDTTATAFQSGKLNFAYGSSTTSQTMTASSSAVVLNDTNTYVIFEYTFKNKNLMQNYRLRVSLTDNANCTNMTRKYYIGDLSNLSVSEKRNVIIKGIDNSAISSQAFTMGYQETGRIYMLLEITPGVMANYSTSSSKPFSFALTTTDGYALNFDSNGGSVVNAKTVYSGSTYGTLPTPTRSGYTFAGWTANLFIPGTASDYTAVLDNINKLIVDKNIIKMTSRGSGGPGIVNNKVYAYTTGDIYTFSHVLNDYDNRILIRILDINGNCLDGTNIAIDGWTWNQYYHSYWWNMYPSVTRNLTITDSSVKQFQVGIACTKDAGIEETWDSLALYKGNDTAPSWFLTSSSQNVFAKDHTLTAVWTKN